MIKGQYEVPLKDYPAGEKELPSSDKDTALINNCFVGNNVMKQTRN
jgi:hypothetical protein